MTAEQPALTRLHARRLREMYRSAGWPCLDVIEIELLAWGLLERVQAAPAVMSWFVSPMQVSLPGPRSAEQPTGIFRP